MAKSIIVEIDGVKHATVLSNKSSCTYCSLNEHCRRYRGFLDCPAESLTGGDAYFELVK